MTVNMLISSGAWILLALGYVSRFRPARHVPLMLSGITLDIAMVLYLQITKNAVQKAAAFSLGLLPQLHIAASLAALLLYLPVIFLGVKLIGGNYRAQHRRAHIKLASLALIFRTLGFLLMFSMWKS